MRSPWKGGSRALDQAYIVVGHGGFIRSALGFFRSALRLERVIATG